MEKKMEKKKFVGRAKHAYDGGEFWEYCIVNPETGALFGAKKLEKIAMLVAFEFGNNFKEGLEYNTKPIANEGTTYYRLKPSEQRKLEKATAAYTHLREIGLCMQYAEK